MRRAGIGLGDWLRAMHQLGLAGDAQASAVARLLGLEVGASAQAATGPELADPPPPPPPPPPHPPPPPPPPPPRDPEHSTRWRGGLLRLLPAMPLAPPPLPRFTRPALARPGRAESAAAPPLLDPATTRALLTVLASSPAPGGEVDVERLVAAVARRRLPRALPQALRATLRRGVQVLVDTAPGMEPFGHDAQQLVAALRKLLPHGQVQVGRLLGGPELSCWMEGAKRPCPWPAPPPGAALLLLSDLGIAGDPPGSRHWAALARAAKALGVPVRALVPQPPMRWPADATRWLQPVHWDRSLTASALKGSPATATATPLQRAAQIDSLARYSSLAVRVDAPLLRRLRLQMLPCSDAGIEAELWCGDQTESHGGEGFVLHAETLPALRDELRHEILPDGRHAMTVAAGITKTAHDAWPAALKLEERLTVLALDGSTVDWALEWEPVLAAIASGEPRALEIARWAVRAIPRLPDAARHCEPARAVLLASALRIGGSSRTLAGSAPPTELLGLLPPLAMTHEPWTVDADGSTLLLRRSLAQDPAERRIELPATRPPVLELFWQQNGSAHRQLVPVQAGQALPLPEGADEVELRALGGAVWRVMSEGLETGSDEGWRAWHACLYRSNELTGMAALVFPGHLLTVRGALRIESDKKPMLEELVIGGQVWRDVPVQVIDDVQSDLVMLEIGGQPPLPQVPQPRLGEAVPSSRGQDFQATVWRAGRQTWLTDVVISVTELAEIRLDAGRESVPPGAVILADGVVEGMAQSGDELLPASFLSDFMAWALRPPEHWPNVWVPLPARGDGGLRNWLAPLMSSLRQRAHWYSQRPSLLEVAGVVMLPERGPAWRDPAVLELALRCWADERFGVLLIDPYGKSSAKLPRPFEHLKVMGPDQHSTGPTRRALHDIVDGTQRRQKQVPQHELLLHDVQRELWPERRPTMYESPDLEPTAAFRVPTQQVLAARLAEVVRKGTAAQARELLERITMLLLGDGPWMETLRNAHASLGPLSMPIVPLQLARLALRKAFYPLPPWRHVALRQPIKTASELVAAVTQEVSIGLGIPANELHAPLKDFRAPYFVFLMNPVPEPWVIKDAMAQLGGTIFISLGDPPKFGTTLAGPELPDRGLPLMMHHYKPLMQIVEPRPASPAKAGRRTTARK